MRLSDNFSLIMTAAEEIAKKEARKAAQTIIKELDEVREEYEFNCVMLSRQTARAILPTTCRKHGVNYSELTVGEIHYITSER